MVCDIFARYHRLKGNKVLLVSGSDSHGAPVVFKAEQEGITPEQMAKQAHDQIVSTYKKLGLLYDNYTRTTTEIHKEVAQNIFLVLKENGYLNIAKSHQYYDPEVNRFLPDRYVRGICPICGANNARGDECPECGSYLEPEQLIDPYSTLSKATPEIRETEHFYMDLRALQEPIKTWLEEVSGDWRKWVREFSLGWIKQGLEPRPVTRDMKYGVPVPVKGWDNKVLYVWIEAVIGYLSASIEWAEKRGTPSAWEDFWKDPKCKHFYFIAGGNVPFHTILWPAELIAYNEKYNSDEEFRRFLLPGESKQKPLNLPFDVPGNNMLFFKGKKMSKGDGTGISVDDLIERYGADSIRYFFVKYAPEKQDRDFSWKDFIEANNCELVANLGNFIYRTLTFTYSKFDGVVPNGQIDSEVKDQISSAFKEVAGLIEKAEFVRSIERILELGHFANKYFNDSKPWETLKNDHKAAENSIYNNIQIVNALRILLKPYTPFASEVLRTSISLSGEYDANIDLEKNGEVSELHDTWNFKEVPVGHKINEPKILFEKFEYTDELKNIDNPPDTLQKDPIINFTVSDELKSIPTIWSSYYDLDCRKLKPQQRSILDEMVHEVIDSLPGDWKKDPKLVGFKNLHDKYSSNKDLPGSVELLIERILMEGSLPRINAFVDIYNYVSIKTGVSIGAHDISKLMGDPVLKLLDKDKDFLEIGTGEMVVANKGEYAYTDQAGILCRLDIKQSQRTRVSEKTKNILVIFQGHEDISVNDLEDAKSLLEELVLKFELRKREV